MKLPVIRDNSTGRRILRAKQEMVLEAAKAWALLWGKTHTAAEWLDAEAVMFGAVVELRKAERGDHAKKK
jgi:hypothetical protein